MQNLLSPPLMVVKSALFVLIAWASSRAYYFAFYVVQHYVDPSLRFAGLSAFAAWWWRQRKR